MAKSIDLTPFLLSFSKIFIYTVYSYRIKSYYLSMIDNNQKQRVDLETQRQQGNNSPADDAKLQTKRQNTQTPAQHETDASINHNP